MKKLLALLAALGLTVGLATSCSLFDSSQSESSSSSSSGTTAEIPGAPTVTGIQAAYNGEGTVYTSTTLETIKASIGVEKIYSDETKEAVTEFTLSGELTAGECILTVEADGFQTQVTVTVVAVVPTEIEVDFYKGDAVVYASASADTLKQYATVTVYYNDGTSAELDTEDYTIAGTMECGTQTFTVAYNGLEDTFSTKIEAVVVTGINVSVASEYEIGLSATEDNVKALLTVTADKNDGSSETVADYSISGEVKGGASDFVVSYEGFNATATITFTVPAETMDETGSKTALTEVGDKFIENFAEVNSGANYDAAWGTDLVWARKATKDSIDGYGMFVSYKGAGETHGDRSAVILEGIGLTAKYTYKVSYDVKPLSGTVTEIGVEMQNAGIWTSVDLSTMTAENGVYSVSHNITMGSSIPDGTRFLIYAPRKDANPVSYVIDNFVVELISIPVEETFSEEGSKTALSAVGDQYIENFGSIPSGVAFDVAWGNNQNAGVLSGAEAIDGNSLIVSYSGEGRSAVCVNGLKLQASTGYKVNFAFKVLSSFSPAEIGIEVQYGNIWTSKLLSDLTKDNGVYNVELTFTTASDLNTTDACILIYCPRGDGEVDEVKYAIDNFVVEVTSAPEVEETVIDPIDETGSTKELTTVGAYYRENFTDGTDGNFDGAYGSVTGWGFEENGISGRSYYLDYSDSSNRACMLINGITLKAGYTYQLTCLMSYTASATASVLDIEIPNTGIRSQYISHFAVNNGVYSVVLNFTADQDVNGGTLLMMISNFNDGGAVRMLVDNLQIKCVEASETGSTKDLTTVGAYYRENFTDGTDGNFDGAYGSVTGWGFEENGISGRSYYLDYSDSSNRACMLINGITLKAGYTYRFTCQMKYTANAEAAVVDLEAAGGVHSKYISHCTQSDGVYNVVIEFTAGQDVNSGTLLFRIANFDNGEAVRMIVDNLEISCTAVA